MWTNVTGQVPSDDRVFSREGDFSPTLRFGWFASISDLRVDLDDLQLSFSIKPHGIYPVTFFPSESLL